MQKMALLVCLMACSAAPDTNTECSATLSCAGNFQIGCNAYEAIDHRMSQTRAWIIEFPDGGPIYTVTGNQMSGNVQIVGRGAGTFTATRAGRPAIAPSPSLGLN